MAVRFEILDVGHGSCSLIEDENHNLILIDCGMKNDPYFSPTDYLYGIGHRSIERLFITNFDEDHINNLPELRSRFPISILHRNNSLSSSELRRIKEEISPLSNAMISLLDMMDNYSSDVVNPPSFPNINWNCYWHKYPSDFTDTNNLSFVVFFKIKDISVLIPGDLEISGWQKHLGNPGFIDDLRSVNIFIASHHGRENGYYQDVFNYCHPDVIVISDDEKQFASQETINQYAQHSKGVQLNGSTRKVLTTRNDGGLCWTI